MRKTQAELHLHTEIIALEGGSQLDQVVWRNRRTGERERHAIRHVYLTTGAAPKHMAGWPLKRPPQLLETSLPGVFAAFSL